MAGPQANLVVAVATAATAAVAAAPGVHVEVNTTLGPIIGVVEHSRTGVPVAVYRGVPFAADTGGANRWRPPQPRQPWHVPINCTGNGYGCVQPHHNEDVPCDGQPPAPGQKCQSEDCLNVNVYCPTAPPQDPAGYPVMFWIYGGAFNEGMNWGPMNIYDGTELAARGGVCVVGTNYRLGVLGFAVLGDTATGNQAIQDQRAALTWTRDNIARFHGNAGSVTIWGESAGAMSVAIHLVSPASKGLFHRAIMESNVASYRYQKAGDQKATFGAQFAKLAKCKKGDLTCLRALDARTAIDLGEKATGGVGANIINRILEGGRVEDAFAMQWSPVVESGSADLPDLPLKIMATKEWHAVPVLIGSNQDEGATFIYAGVKEKLPEALFPALNDGIFGLDGGKVTRFYSHVSKGWHDLRDSMSYMLTDYWFKCSAEYIAAKASAAGVASYVYRFNHLVSFASLFPRYGLPTVCENRTCHMSEVPFVFHNSANYSFSADEGVLSAKMLRYWTNFAKASDPNSGGDPSGVVWPIFNGSVRQNLKLSVPISIESTATGQDSGPGTVPQISPPGVCSFYDSIGYGW
mmetsp:Transcript_34219/g.89789  ORF Transcript_34219/g.89789 Transcript_34219/m.89789 type:complete len:577 (-) Transcript_34219:87-1817(-)